MDFKMIKENKNNVIKRKDMEISFDHNRSATVSKAIVQKAVAEKEKVPVTHVVVNRVVTHRGTTSTVATVEVYNEPKAKDYSVKEAPTEQPTA